jgi:hypothetical protein
MAALHLYGLEVSRPAGGAHRFEFSTRLSGFSQKATPSTLGRQCSQVWRPVARDGIHNQAAANWTAAVNARRTLLTASTPTDARRSPLTYGAMADALAFGWNTL